MKVKYLRLSKDEQKKVQEKFYSTEEGRLVKKYTRISLIMGLSLIGFAVYFSLDAYFNHLSKLYYLYSAILVVIAFIFIFAVRNLRVTKLNNTIIKKKKKNSR